MKEKWIPVEDRLPEKNGQYLVTDRFNDELVTIPAYFSTDLAWYALTDSEPILPYVIAWQPLPDPYQEKQHVDTD